MNTSVWIWKSCWLYIHFCALWDGWIDIFIHKFYLYICLFSIKHWANICINKTETKKYFSLVVLSSYNTATLRHSSISSLAYIIFLHFNLVCQRNLRWALPALLCFVSVSVFPGSCWICHTHIQATMSPPEASVSEQSWLSLLMRWRSQCLAAPQPREGERASQLQQ